MTQEEATDFVEALEAGPTFRWWAFHVHRLEESNHYKVVAKSRVSGKTFDLYERDERAAVEITTYSFVPNNEVAACAWLAQELNKRVGNVEGMVEYLESRIAELENHAGMELSGKERT